MPSPISPADPVGSGCCAAGPAGSTVQPSLARCVRCAWRAKGSHKNMGFVK